LLAGTHLPFYVILKFLIAASGNNNLVPSIRNEYQVSSIRLLFFVSLHFLFLLCHFAFCILIFNFSSPHGLRYHRSQKYLVDCHPVLACPVTHAGQEPYGAEDIRLADVEERESVPLTL